MKKLLIIIPIVIVVAAATVLGLVAAGILGKTVEEPVAQAIEASATDLGVFKDLGTDAYFDVRAPRDPSTSLDNYVVIHDNKGEKVFLKSTRQGDGIYRITARYGFKERTSYQIWATGATFVDEKYAGLYTFIFMTKGEEKEVVTPNPDLKPTKRDGTIVETVTNSDGAVNYNITLPEAVAGHYVTGDVILAKKPAEGLIDEKYKDLYNGDIANYSMNGIDLNGMAAYYVLRTSETINGKEEVYCRLASVNEVVTDLDIYKTLTIDENNFSVNEELLQKALEESDFTAAVYESALEAYDLFSGKFEKKVKDSPEMKARFEYEVGTDKIQLDFYFTITIAKGMDIVFAVKNTIDITPNINAKLNDLTSMDFDLDLGVNLKTKTVCTIEMETTDAKIQAKDIEDFKKKFKEIVSGKTAEKGIVGAELPIYSYKYPIYCFVLGIEFGVDLNLGLKAQISFEYDYYTDITVGVTYVNGEISGYKSIDTSSEAKDLVLLGKIKAEAGVYVKLTASLLEVAGVGLKVKTGAYAEIGGQLRLDMQAAIENKELRVLAGYYVTGGLYLALGFELKAGITLPDPIGFKGWEKYWEPGRWEFPLFEFGSKYIVDSFVNGEMNVDIQGKTYDLSDYKIKVNAFDLDKVADASAIEIGIDAFDFEYLDDAASYITLENGIVTVSPTVGTEFSARVKITPKTGSDASAIITFHKAAVQPTCDETTATFDIKNPEDVTFDVKKNQSTFITMAGEEITASDYIVSSEGAVTIGYSFLSGLTVGDHTFTYVTDKGRIALTVTVIDTTPITATKTTARFSKLSPAAKDFLLNLSGSTVTSVTGLNKGEYSVDSAGVLLIYAFALVNKDEGTYDYVVNASNGSTLTLSVTVEDDRRPVLLKTSFVFGKNNSTTDLTVAYVGYGYTLDSVSGEGIKSTDYTIADGTLTIKKSYFSGVSKGDKTFALSFKKGVETISQNVTVTVMDNATVIAVGATATFDFNDPKEAEFTVIATAAFTITGAGITADDYVVDGNTVKFKVNYLKSRTADTVYTYTVTASDASDTLTLKVVDTTVPAIDNAVGGVATITYDKREASSDKEKSFTLILPNGADLKKLDGNRITTDDYILSAQNGKIIVTLTDNYLSELRVGTYEFNVLTTVNVSSLVVNVIDTSVPEPGEDASLTYVLHSGDTKRVTIKNYEHGLKSIEVKGGEAISLFSGDCDFDVTTGEFTLNPLYLETLPANTYVTLNLTFDDEAATVVSITIAVNA